VSFWFWNLDRDTRGHPGTPGDTREHPGTPGDTREHPGTPGDSRGHPGTPIRESRHVRQGLRDAERLLPVVRLGAKRMTDHCVFVGVLNIFNVEKVYFDEIC